MSVPTGPATVGLRVPSAANQLPERMSLRAALLTVSLASALVLAGCGPAEPDVVEFGDVPEQGAPETDGDVDVHDVDRSAAAPPVDAELASGGWPEAAAYIAREADAGRPTLVNLFASWCVPCRAEMPLLNEAYEENEDVAFLGIDHLDRLEDGEEFVDEYGVEFATIHDIDGDVAFAVGSRGMPTTVVFDRDGRLAGRVVGELTDTSLEALLDEVR